MESIEPPDEQDGILSASIEVDDSFSEHIGTSVGPYKLMELIGQGGFGLVFVAEQLQPVRRKVALKLIKPGTGTREVVARFEAERQALALMDHPNIARVLDAGEKANGTPYFVMELVRGVPITEFSDQHRLGVDLVCNSLDQRRLILVQNKCQRTKAKYCRSRDAIRQSAAVTNGRTCVVLESSRLQAG